MAGLVNRNSQNYRIIFIIPMYNEVNNIKKVLIELFEIFESSQALVIDDASTDSSLYEVKSLSARNVLIVENQINLGHGRSLIKGLKRSFEIPDWDILITFDSDANFYLRDLEELFEEFISSDVDVLESVRVNRGDLWFRKWASFATRFLVRSATGSSTQDANTPVRIYSREVIEKLIDIIPKRAQKLPNVYFSIITRLTNWKYMSAELKESIRQGNSISGSTWKQKKASIPSHRYLIFCLKEVLNFPLNVLKIKTKIKRLHEGSKS